MSAKLNKVEKQIVKAVAADGFFATGVFSDEGAPNFLYTIGFWETLGSPEVIILGLDFDLMHSMAWEMFRQIKAGASLSDGKRFSDLLAGDYECIARPVHLSQAREYLLSARWYRRYRGKNPDRLRVFQIFWPGVQQRLFPWNAGCAAGVRNAQPRLYLPLKRKAS